jgi:hypothetical protein
VRETRLTAKDPSIILVMQHQQGGLFGKGSGHNYGEKKLDCVLMEAPGAISRVADRVPS